MRSWNNLIRPEFSTSLKHAHVFLNPATVCSNYVGITLNACSQTVMMSRFGQDLSAWTHWASRVRDRGDVTYILGATMDELGRAMYAGASKLKQEAGSTLSDVAALFQAFKAVQETMVAPSIKVNNYGKRILESLANSGRITLSYEWTPASVFETVYPQIPDLSEADAEAGLFKAPSLSQPWCSAVATITTYIDMLRWKSSTLSFLADAQAIDGISITSRTAYDLKVKLQQMKSAVTLFALYELQPLIAYARMVLPFYRYVQSLNSNLYRDDDRLVKRGSSLIDGIQDIANYRLHDVLDPVCATYQSAMTVDTIWGEIPVIPFVGRSSGAKDGRIVDICNVAANVAQIDPVSGVPMTGQQAVALNLVEQWRKMLSESPGSNTAWKGLYGSTSVSKNVDGKEEEKFTAAIWLHWRHVINALNGFIGLANLDQMVQHLEWSGNSVNLGAMKMQSRGADFMFSDAERYQGNSWQAASGITPVLMICNPMSTLLEKRTMAQFGIGTNIINKYPVGVRGVYGDDTTDSIVARFYIPKSASCYESHASDEHNIAASQPAVVSFYESRMERVVDENYSQNAPVLLPAGIVETSAVKQDSWDGSISSSNSADLKKAVILQWSSQMTPVSSAQFVSSDTGFNMRVVVHLAHDKRYCLSDRWGKIIGLIAEPGDVIFDERDEKEMVLSGDSHEPLSAYSVHLMDTQKNRVGGVVVGQDFFNERG